MKKLNLIFVTALSAGLLQACSGPKDSKAAADSVNAVKDTSTKPFAQSDSTKTTPAHIEVDKKDAEFAVEAMAGGMEEVALGKLAQEKAINPKVKEFGAMMVDDHSKAGQELSALGQTLRIALPNALDNDGQKLSDELSKKSGADFDKAYVSDMIDDHKKDIKAFEDESKNSNSVDLKKWADKTLPVLHKHLEAIQKIHDSMK